MIRCTHPKSFEIIFTDVKERVSKIVGATTSKYWLERRTNYGKVPGSSLPGTGTLKFTTIEFEDV